MDHAVGDPTSHGTGAGGGGTGMSSAVMVDRSWQRVIHELS